MNITPNEVETAGRAICRETCAFMGEPPCWEVNCDHDEQALAWPSPHCNEPGCIALATAALLALKTR